MRRVWMVRMMYVRSVRVVRMWCVGMVRVMRMVRMVAVGVVGVWLWLRLRSDWRVAMRRVAVRGWQLTTRMEQRCGGCDGVR